MKKLLIVVDMQNDFIDGALGTKEAVAIVPNVEKKMKEFQGDIICTRDTHFENYLDTQEGKNLPVPHCIKGTDGWNLASGIASLCETRDGQILDKITFGSRELPKLLEEKYPEGFDEVELAGLCTDICVISNAMVLKAWFPEVKITVDASCCAGVTPQSHKNALEAMKMCQINIIEQVKTY